ncbi:MAG TPA: Holliday junction branch migration protein RuvA [Chitinophagales bacterium]|nr:Holliday junction branch migration protein RuvA [Chitinophagales bacterium]
MIAYLSGQFTVKNPAYMVVECNGVGYQVHISLATYSKIQGMEKGRIHTYMVVREDAQLLFGFADETEKNMFVNLLSVQGVGPNTARMILSSMNVDELEQAILSENDPLIQKIKGVGPKTAKRIVIDLKDKVVKGLPGTENSFGASHNTIKEEALIALAMLGFSRQQGEKAIAAALKNSPNPVDVENLIKLALKNL